MRISKRVTVERELTMDEFRKVLHIDPRADVTIGMPEWRDDYRGAGRSAEVLKITSVVYRHSVKKI